MNKLHNKKETELIKDLLKERENIRSIRFNSRGGSGSSNVKEARETKKKIARILTELRKREVEKAN